MKGVYTALITPLTEDFKFDENGFIENLNFQINEKVDGLVVLGTTAESPTLTEDEQTQIIKLAVKTSNGKVPVWVGTGSASTHETIKKTSKAKELGADGALVVVPYYNRPSQEGLAQHFEAVANTCHFPMMVYNIQGRTGQNLELDTLMRLMDCPEIIAIKEASGNIGQIMRTIEEVRPGFAVFSGDDALTLPVIALGGVGVVSVLSNLIPSLINELTNAALNGNFEKARELHYRLSPLMRVAFIETNPSPIKILMDEAGMKAGPLRLPLVRPTKENITKIVTCYKEILTLQN